MIHMHNSAPNEANTVSLNDMALALHKKSMLRSIADFISALFTGSETKITQERKGLVNEFLDTLRITKSDRQTSVVFKNFELYDSPEGIRIRDYPPYGGLQESVLIKGLQGHTIAHLLALTECARAGIAAGAVNALPPEEHSAFLNHMLKNMEYPALEQGKCKTEWAEIWSPDCFSKAVSPDSLQATVNAIRAQMTLVKHLSAHNQPTRICVIPVEGKSGDTHYVTALIPHASGEPCKIFDGDHLALNDRAARNNVLLTGQKKQAGVVRNSAGEAMVTALQLASQLKASLPESEILVTHFNNRTLQSLAAPDREYQPGEPAHDLPVTSALQNDNNDVFKYLQEKAQKVTKGYEAVVHLKKEAEAAKGAKQTAKKDDFPVQTGNLATLQETAFKQSQSLPQANAFLFNGSIKHPANPLEINDAIIHDTHRGLASIHNIDVYIDGERLSHEAKMAMQTAAREACDEIHQYQPEDTLDLENILLNKTTPAADKAGPIADKLANKVVEIIIEKTGSDEDTAQKAAAAFIYSLYQGGAGHGVVGHLAMTSQHLANVQDNRTIRITTHNPANTRVQMTRTGVWKTNTSSPEMFNQVSGTVFTLPAAMDTNISCRQMVQEFARENSSIDGIQGFGMGCFANTPQSAKMIMAFAEE